MSSTAPIIFIGTQRSGTTWMGTVFDRHPRIAYWPEPRHLWTWGNAYKPDDVLAAADARPSVTRHIRREVDRFVQRAGKDRLAEKTPSNCLRIPFIHAIFPEAKIILVIRDGRSVLRSTSEIMQGSVPTNRMLQRAFETPFWEWPAYLPRAASTIMRKITRRPLAYWGVRPPGWQEWVGSESREVMLAKQWVATIQRASEDAHALPEHARFIFHYEDLMREPRRVMQDMVDFCKLEDAEDLVAHVESTADPARQAKWRDALDEQVLDRIRPIMEPTLTQLGYQW